MLSVKTLIRKIEFFPERFAVERRFPVGGKDPVGGFEDGCEVVHQRPGPVEDDIADHCSG